MRTIEARLMAASRGTLEGHHAPLSAPADALLLVSGSHPVRSLPGARWYVHWTQEGAASVVPM